MSWGLRAGISGHTYAWGTAFSEKHEKGVEGKVHWVVGQAQVRGSWQSLAESRCPVQAPQSGGHKLHLEVR